MSSGGSWGLLQDLSPRVGLLQKGFLAGCWLVLREDAEQGAACLCDNLQAGGRWPQPSVHLRC